MEKSRDCRNSLRNRGELEWRQGGELWEQGRIHWKLFEAKKPDKGS